MQSISPHWTYVQEIARNASLQNVKQFPLRRTNDPNLARRAASFPECFGTDSAVDETWFLLAQLLVCRSRDVQFTRNDKWPLNWIQSVDECHLPPRPPWAGEANGRNKAYYYAHWTLMTVIRYCEVCIGITGDFARLSRQGKADIRLSHKLVSLSIMTRRDQTTNNGELDLMDGGSQRRPSGLRLQSSDAEICRT